MKNLSKIPMLLLAAVLFAAGCGKDKIDFPGEQPRGEETGYLVLAGMNVGVSADVETVVSGNAAPANGRTRATADADDAYRIAVTHNSTSATAWSGTYAEIKAMTAPLELAPGRYTVTAQSPGTIQPLAWEQPAYAGSAEFTIVKKATTTVNDLVCTLSNIKTTVELSADLKELFLNDGTDDLKTTVSLGTTACEFGRDETRAAYFEAVGATNTLTVVLSGQYNVKGEGETPEYQPVVMTQQISNVKAGQWRKIAISIEHADDGNVQFVVTVETWVYDDRIDVNVMSNLYTFGEEEIPDVDEEISDPDAPAVMLDGGHYIADPFPITAASFDFDFDPVRCNDLINLIATPVGQATVTDAYCVFDSDNADFLAALETAGHADHRIAVWPDNGATDYLVARTDANNRLIVKVNDAGMYGLYAYEGTHTAKIVVTDSQNRRSYTTLTISVVRGGGSETGPSITGLTGFDLATRHTITVSSTLKAAVHVTSATGITAFRVVIQGGDVLPDAELVKLDLAPEMDLINPASEAMKVRLQELGFLPKDGSSIEGKTDMTFDISEFIPAMCVLDGTGHCDFKVIVTDAAGTAEQTLMFNVVH